MNTTEAIARCKRAIERILRGIGFSRAEAKRAVSRMSRRSARLAAVASFACLAAWNMGLR